MLRYKFDVMQALKERGYTTYYFKTNRNTLGQRTVEEIRDGKIVGTKSLDKLCALLELQPGDIIEWIPDQEDD